MNVHEPIRPRNALVVVVRHQKVYGVTTRYDGVMYDVKVGVSGNVGQKKLLAMLLVDHRDRSLRLSRHKGGDVLVFALPQKHFKAAAVRGLKAVYENNARHLFPRKLPKAGLFIYKLNLSQAA